MPHGGSIGTMRDVMPRGAAEGLVLMVSKAEDGQYWWGAGTAAVLYRRRERLINIRNVVLIGLPQRSAVLSPESVCVSGRGEGR